MLACVRPTCASSSRQRVQAHQKAQSTQRVMNADKLPLTAQVIDLNPEMPTAWSYRRRLLLHILSQTKCVCYYPIPTSPLTWYLAAIQWRNKSYFHKTLISRWLLYVETQRIIQFGNIGNGCFELYLHPIGNSS